MEFAPFSGIDNAGLKLIFPNEYDTVYDAATDLEWLFYGNEWTLCGEGRPWQGTDQDLELMCDDDADDADDEAEQDEADQDLAQWLEAWPTAIKQSLGYDHDEDLFDYGYEEDQDDEDDQDPLGYDYGYDNDQDLIKDWSGDQDWGKPLFLRVQI